MTTPYITIERRYKVPEGEPQIHEFRYLKGYPLNKDNADEMVKKCLEYYNRLTTQELISDLVEYKIGYRNH